MTVLPSTTSWTTTVSTTLSTFVTGFSTTTVWISVTTLSSPPQAATSPATTPIRNVGTTFCNALFKRIVVTVLPPGNGSKENDSGMPDPSGILATFQGTV